MWCMVISKVWITGIQQTLVPHTTRAVVEICTCVPACMYVGRVNLRAAGNGKVI